MIQAPAATEAKTGDNKGKIPAYEWATSVKTENAPGAPVNDKGVVILKVPGDSFTVTQFENVGEILEAAGTHYDQWLLDTVNNVARASQIRSRAQKAKALEVYPGNAAAWVNDPSFSFDAAAFFKPTERSANTAIKADLANVLASLDSGSASAEDVIAKLRLLAGGAKA